VGTARDDVTRTLAAVRGGDEEAAARLMDLVYDPLRAIAGRAFRDQPVGHTLQATALVHEVFLQVVGRTEVEWSDRAHFYAVCARAMRGILVDHARRRGAAKRGGDLRRVTLSTDLVTPADEDEGVDLLDLDEALDKLAELSERQARIVEYRFFSDMTIEEVAHALGVSPRTVNDDWAMARAWISARLSRAS
jgi:RNA polymerase sigma factor (TIGR02999 family)